MKRVYILLAVFLIFLIPLISASQIELNKQEFDKGETLFAKISGNFVDQITRDNVHFYRGGHVEIFSVEFEIEKIDEDFYLYANLPINPQETNHSLRIEDVRYYQATEIVDETIRENFTISNQTADFSITPGFIESTNDFFVEIINLVDRQIDVAIESSDRIETEPSLELNIGEEDSTLIQLRDPLSEEKINFSTENTEYTFWLFVPFGSPTTGEDLEKDFSFETEVIEISMSTDSDTKRVIYLKNEGETSIEDIELSVSEDLKEYISLNPSSINELDFNESIKIELSINSDAENKTLEGLIIASSDTGNLSIQDTSIIILDFIPNFIPSNQTSQDDSSAKLCSEVGGEICGDSEVCDGDIFHAQDGTCCLGVCEEESSGLGSTAKWIGWTLIILIVGFVFWFYKSKYKKTGSKSDGLGKFLSKKKK